MPEDIQPERKKISLLKLLADRQQSDGPECRVCGCRHFILISTETNGRFLVKKMACRNCRKEITRYERAEQEKTRHEGTKMHEEEKIFASKKKRKKKKKK